MSEHIADHRISKIPLLGRWLLLARAAALGLVVMTVLLKIADVPLRFEQLQIVCTNAACGEDIARLTPSLVRVLDGLGYTVAGYAAYTVSINLVMTLVCWVIAGVIFWRKFNDPMALFLALCLVLLGSAFTGHASMGDSFIWSLLWKIVEFFASVSLILVFCLFPSGRWVPSWIRWVAVAVAANEFTFVFFPNTPLDLGFWSPALALLFWIGPIIVVVGAQIYRYRFVSTPTERQQTKWVVYGLAVAILGPLAYVLPLVFFAELDGSAYVLAFNTVLTFFLLTLPLSIGIAILRSRLFDIDIIINRTLVYTALTVSLAVIYVGCVVLLRQILAPLSGSSELAIVASTLAIAVLFNPLRKRTQALIDKRFYRRKYDAAKVLAAFGVTARDETNLDALTAELVRVVDETMQPEFVGLWLRDPQARSTTEAARPDLRPPR
jgi:hypothetical protein